MGVGCRRVRVGSMCVSEGCTMLGCGRENAEEVREYGVKEYGIGVSVHDRVIWGVGTLHSPLYPLV
jgi:hypothetical protein